MRPQRRFDDTTQSDPPVLLTRAVRLLVERAGLAHLWVPGEGVRRTKYLSTGEQVIVTVAEYLYGGRGDGGTLADLAKLDVARGSDVASLVQAIIQGDGQLALWIERHSA